jgi:glycosyltransferase involved in cell wall biosynthesis
LSAVDPYPTDAGKKVVLAGFVEYLTDRLGQGNVHYVMVGGHATREFPARLHQIDKPRTLGVFGSLLTRTGTGRASLQEAMLSTTAVRGAIRRTLDRISPDVEIYDTVRMAQHAPAHRTNQICYLDDLFSKRYESMLVAALRYPDIDIQPLGNFAPHVPHFVRPLAEHRRSQQLLLRLEQQLVRRSEDRSVHRFDTTLLISEREAALLRHRTGADAGRVQSIPPLINQSEPVVREYRGVPEFVFLGQLSLPHNDDGLRSFLTSVWPRVLALRPDARLRVVGRYPRAGLIDLAQRADGVTLEGFVPDLSEILCRAAAMVNPLRFGSGVKLKVIEALGAGVPVISTTIGSKGIASGPDHGVLVADDDAELADMLLGVTDRAHNDRLATAAREHFARCYSRDAVFARYDAAFGLG